MSAIHLKASDREGGVCAKNGPWYHHDNVTATLSLVTCRRCIATVDTAPVSPPPPTENARAGADEACGYRGCTFPRDKHPAFVHEPGRTLRPHDFVGPAPLPPTGAAIVGRDIAERWTPLCSEGTKALIAGDIMRAIDTAYAAGRARGIEEERKRWMDQFCSSCLEAGNSCGTGTCLDCGTPIAEALARETG